jgi:hypothetical protein
MDRLSVLACVTGLAMLAVFFALAWAGVPNPDWLPMVITAIAGFEMYMVFDSARRRRA